MAGHNDPGPDMADPICLLLPLSVSAADVRFRIDDTVRSSVLILTLLASLLVPLLGYKPHFISLVRNAMCIQGSINNRVRCI